MNTKTKDEVIECHKKIVDEQLVINRSRKILFLESKIKITEAELKLADFITRERKKYDAKIVKLSKRSDKLYNKTKKLIEPIVDIYPELEAELIAYCDATLTSRSTSLQTPDQSL